MVIKLMFMTESPTAKLHHHHVCLIEWNYPKLGNKVRVSHESSASLGHSVFPSGKWGLWCEAYILQLMWRLDNSWKSLKIQVAHKNSISKLVICGMGVHACVHACVHAKSLQSCLPLWDSVDCSLPHSSVLGVLQAEVLEWIAMPSSRGPSLPRDQTHVPYISYICSLPLTPPGKPWNGSIRNQTKWNTIEGMSLDSFHTSVFLY